MSRSDRTKKRLGIRNNIDLSDGNLSWIERKYLRFWTRRWRAAWKRVQRHNIMQTMEGVYGRRLDMDHLIITPEKRGQLVYIVRIVGDKDEKKVGGVERFKKTLDAVRTEIDGQLQELSEETGWVRTGVKSWSKSKWR